MEKTTASRKLAGAALAGLIALVASHSASPSASAVSPIDACKLIDKSQLVRILNEDVSDGRREDDGYTSDGAYSSTCVWKIVPRGESADSEQAAASHEMILLNAFRWIDNQASRKYLAAFVNASRDGTIAHPIERVALGDESLWWGDGLAVRVGNISFGVSVWRPAYDVAVRKQLSQELAKEVVNNVR